MNSTILFGFLIGFIIVGGFGVFVIVPNFEQENLQTESQKFLDFQNTNQTCSQLKKLYQGYEGKKYDSIINVHWFNGIRGKLIDNGCISQDELNNREFIAICKDGKTMGCEISRIKNPELYENFQGIFPNKEK